MPQARRPYSRRYLQFEKALGWLYSGSWPAALWNMLPAGRRIAALHFAVETPGRDGRPPLRIAFASDFHLGPTTPRQLLDQAFGLLVESRADVLALGGDFVFLGATHARVEELKARVAAVPAPVKLAVLGNHDFWARPERIEDGLRDVGVRVLVNQALRLPPPHDDVAVVGLDDPLTLRGVREPLVDREAVDAALRSVTGAATTIALCHSPDGMPALRGSGVRLFLCGHTHGGHIALPGCRPVYMPSRYGRLWPYGRHEVDGTTILVSRGVGGSLVPMRMYAPPDVMVVDLLPTRVTPR